MNGRACHRLLLHISAIVRRSGARMVHREMERDRSPSVSIARGPAGTRNPRTATPPACKGAQPGPQKAEWTPTSARTIPAPAQTRSESPTGEQRKKRESALQEGLQRHDAHGIGGSDAHPGKVAGPSGTPGRLRDHSEGRSRSRAKASACLSCSMTPVGSLPILRSRRTVGSDPSP